MDETLSYQKKKARQLGMTWIADIVKSPLKNKKYRVVFKDGRHVDYGAVGYDDFLVHKDDARRARFWNRWKNNPNLQNKLSPVFYFVLNW